MGRFPGSRIYRRAGEVEDAHLEGQQQKSPGDPAHGGEGGDDQGDERRNERVDFHAGHGKEHTHLLCNFSQN